MDRREFLKRLGLGAVASSSLLSSCKNGDKNFLEEAHPEKMTYRINPKTKDKVSLLGYGCMRLPTIDTKDKDGNITSEIDQEMVNRLVDYAISNGVNFFDTSPAYCQGRSETSMGIALSRYNRDKYFVSTKLSNFVPSTWTSEESKKIYHNSFRRLQVEYIDYMLLHACGMPSANLDGMETFEARYINNGILDFLVKEREAGRIRNLGFSYHGDIAVFDHLLAQHSKYHWDFVLIQLNYVDWKHAKEVNPRNTNAEYLYSELEKRDIPALIMEPLLGGRLASINYKSASLLKSIDPEASMASWAFRFSGSQKGVLSVLSGMTYMENLRENIATYSPLKPINRKEAEILEMAAKFFLDYPLIQCNKCDYCMPCPYGLDIPGIFTFYNRCLNEGRYAQNSSDPNYRKARREFLIGYSRKIEKQRQADHCINCKKCVPHCPQRIDIPQELRKIDLYVENLRRSADGLL